MATGREVDAAHVAGAVQALLREAASLAATLSERTGLHPSDVRALRALDLLAGGPLTAGELGAALELSSAAVTGLVDRLEVAGLARRVPHPSDRRRVHVTLTDDARRFGADMMRPLQERIASAIAASSDRDLTAAARVLGRIVHASGAAGEGERPPRSPRAT
jgi:DNA-binding MarR family transcriptional regulator